MRCIVRWQHRGQLLPVRSRLSERTGGSSRDRSPGEHRPSGCNRRLLHHVFECCPTGRDLWHDTFQLTSWCSRIRDHQPTFQPPSAGDRCEADCSGRRLRGANCQSRPRASSPASSRDRGCAVACRRPDGSRWFCARLERLPVPLLAQRLPAGAFSSCTPVSARCADCPTSPSGQPSSPVCSASAHAVIEKFALRQRILGFSAS